MSISTQLQAVRDEYGDAWMNDREPDTGKIDRLITESPEFKRIIAQVITAHLPEPYQAAVFPIYGQDARNGTSTLEQQQRAGRTQESIIQAIRIALNEDDIEKCSWQVLLFTDRNENPVTVFPFSVPMTVPETPQDETGRAAAAADVLAYSKLLSERIPDVIARTQLYGAYCMLQYNELYLSVPGVLDNLQYSETEKAEKAEREKENALADLVSETYGIESAADIVKQDIKPVSWLVDGILQDQGTGILAGAEKVGKSYFALQLAIHAAQGKPFLTWKTKRTDTLYVDIDGRNKGRTKKRIQEIAGGNVPGNLVFYETKRKGTYFPTIGETPGTFDVIKGLIIKAKRERGLDIRFVIVDVLADILPLDGKGNQDAYRQGRREMRNITPFAEENNLFLLLITHTRKSPDAENPFNMVSGSNALFSAADAGLLLVRPMKEKHAALFVNGRDQTQEKFILEFDQGTYRYAGTADEYKETYEDELYKSHPIRKALVTLFNEHGILPGNLSDIKEQYERETGKGLPYTPADIGMFLTQNESKFRELDGIKFVKTRGRTYTFEKLQP